MKIQIWNNLTIDVRCSIHNCDLEVYEDADDGNLNMCFHELKKVGTFDLSELFECPVQRELWWSYVNTHDDPPGGDVGDEANDLFPECQDSWTAEVVRKESA